MAEYDVRDLRGRIHRLWQATVIGILGSLGVTLLLPTRDHFPIEPGGCGFSHQDQGWLVEGGNPSLMIAGAVAITVAAYAVLGALATRRAPRLPRARAVVTRVRRRLVSS